MDKRARAQVKSKTKVKTVIDVENDSVEDAMPIVDTENSAAQATAANVADRERELIRRLEEYMGSGAKYGKSSTLCTYDQAILTEESERDRIMSEYHGDEREITRTKLAVGTACIKDRMRKRTYLHKILERKLEKSVEVSLWKESHGLDSSLEAVEDARRKVRKVRRELLREAEKAIIQIEYNRVRSAKKFAIKEQQRLRAFRLARTVIWRTLLVASITLGALIPWFRLAIANGFRGTVSELLRLDGVRGNAWVACDAIGGLSLDFLNESALADHTCLDNGTRAHYYLYNITNAEQVLRGERPVVNEIGPFDFVVAARKRRIRSRSGWLEVEWQPYYRYVGEEALLDQTVTTVNMGYAQFLATLRTTLGFADTDAVLMALMATQRLQQSVIGHAFASTSVEWATVRIEPGCLTYGCFLAEHEFAVIHANHGGSREILNAYLEEMHFLGIPVFNQIPLSAVQVEAVWVALQPDSGYVQDYLDPDLAVRCSLPSQAACDKFSPSVNNLKIVVDAFLMLWVSAGNTQTLWNTMDFMRFNIGKESGDLQNFYDGILSRDNRCIEKTVFIGELKCTQLNDLMQYFFWLFRQEWQAEQFSERVPAKGPLVAATARSHLVTGLPDASLMVLNVGKNASAFVDSTARDTFTDELARGDTTMFTAQDKAWLRQGWIKPILDMPSSAQIDAFLPSEGVGNQVRRFPAAYVVDNSHENDTGRVLSPVYIAQRRAYHEGVVKPLGVQGAQFMGSIDGSVSTIKFGGARNPSPTQGVDGFQFEPSLDVMYTGSLFDTDGNVYRGNEKQNAWKRRLALWLDLPFRSLAMVTESNFPLEDELGSTVAFDTALQRLVPKRKSEDSDDLQLRWFGLASDRFTRLSSDANSGTTCMIDLSSSFNGIPVFLGYPNYYTCNSTTGETPEMRVTAGNEGLFTEIDNGIFGAPEEENDELGSEIEEPLPLNERALILEPTASMETATNTTMNVVLIEPVTGQAFYSETACGVYVSMPATEFLAREAVERYRLPYYSVIQRHTRDIAQAKELAAMLRKNAREQLTLVWMCALVTICLAILGLLIAKRASQRPELRSARVTPIETLEVEAKQHRDELLKPLEHTLEAKKQIHDDALKEYNRTKEMLTAQNSHDFNMLLADDQDVEPGDGQANTGDNIVYGIASSGEVFSFSNETLKELLEVFGNPLENVAK